jgi:hypothetical protein
LILPLRTTIRKTHDRVDGLVNDVQLGRGAEAPVGRPTVDRSSNASLDVDRGKGGLLEDLADSPDDRGMSERQIS